MKISLFTYPIFLIEAATSPWECRNIPGNFWADGSFKGQANLKIST